ncbi:NmrA family NAD(P)-binding protein [Frondihabitans sucicola]|uniref:NmrA family NAD(P)-binding protein n=1 Tax=Frondihabitans sucicola TaxID=1268041 RepID=UPI0025733D20|nr:NmrA family NAD(P)-binding protein [Frondihabitans sucicola]
MTTSLIAGATGLLGSGIAANLVDQDDVKVRLLVRGGWKNDPAKTSRIDPLVAADAEVVIGDVTDPTSLDAATKGVDVIVSALQGGRDVIVDGQVALATAAVANGVHRFIPSDFAIDLFRAPPEPRSSRSARRLTRSSRPWTSRSSTSCRARSSTRWSTPPTPASSTFPIRSSATGAPATRKST